MSAGDGARPAARRADAAYGRKMGLAKLVQLELHLLAVAHLLPLLGDRLIGGSYAGAKGSASWNGHARRTAGAPPGGSRRLLLAAFDPPRAPFGRRLSRCAFHPAAFADGSDRAGLRQRRRRDRQQQRDHLGRDKRRAHGTSIKRYCPQTTHERSFRSTERGPNRSSEKIEAGLRCIRGARLQDAVLAKDRSSRIRVWGHRSCSSPSCPTRFDAANTKVTLRHECTGSQTWRPDDSARRRTRSLRASDFCSRAAARATARSDPGLPLRPPCG